MTPLSGGAGGDILLLGAGGQLGYELARVLPELGSLTAWTRADCDLANPAAAREKINAFAQARRPWLIVNAAAYTAVDRAESETETARAVNAEIPGVLGGIAARTGALLTHYSTEYVFDGKSARPYRESDAPAPLNVYGQTKLEGERALLASGARSLILRTSWVFGAHGGNFLKTMLRLAGERDTLGVVADQRGAPTSAAWLAQVTRLMLRRYRESQRAGQGGLFRDGLYHLTAAGETTWHDYAAHIFSRARQAGVALRLRPENLVALTSREYKTPAARPENSLLDNRLALSVFGFSRPDWKEGVDAVLREILPAFPEGKPRAGEC
ncbi:MAG: dTDP-4-dehydrorhamnose reductase [Zoogloeaceae bacterium]|jgi:dTDP-4-dehydrorhamnose reductase|nr:dTDP-4-dehydrorhamnose reductase [Zoogloeaceae bacterium]